MAITDRVGITPSQDPSVEQLREAVEIFKGVRGSPYDRALRVRDLVDAGLVQINPAVLKLSGGSSNYNPILPIGDGDTDRYSKVPPDQLTNLAVLGTFGAILLDWDPWNDPKIAYIEVWRNDVDNLANAILVGTTTSFVYTDAVGESGKGYYYWVRAVSYANVKGAFNATPGTYGETALDVTKLLDDLNGQLTASQLDAALSARIDLIDTPLTGLVDRVADHDVQIASVQSDADANTAAITALTSSVNTIDGQVTANANAITGVEADLGTLGATVSSQGSALSALDVTVTQIDGLLDTTVTNLDAVTATVNNPTTGVAATATGLSQLEATVASLDGEISAEVSRTDQLVIDFQKATAASTVIYRTGAISNSWPANTTISSADTWSFTPGTATPIGAGWLHILMTDAEGGVRVAYNGVQLSPNPSAPDLDTKWFSWPINITSSTQTIKVWAATGDGGSVKGIVVTAGGKGDPDAAHTGYIAFEEAAVLRTDVNGLFGQYTVKFDNNGYVSGFGLSTEPSIDGTPTSNAEFLVNNFYIRSPGATSANFIVTGGKVVMPGAYIQDATITNAKIGNAAISTAKIANLAVDSSKIKDANITSAKIASAAVTNAKIANAAVTNAKIGNAAITAAKIGTAAVETAKIKDAAVQTLKIQDQAVTFPKATYISSQGSIQRAQMGVETTVASFSMTVTGGRVIVWARVNVRSPASYSTSNDEGSWWQMYSGVLRFYEDSTKRHEVTVPSLGRNNLSEQIITMLYSYVPTAGTKTFSLRLYYGNYYLMTSSTAYGYYKQRSLVVMETKR